MTATDYPTIHNCNFSTREDETGRLVRQALDWADAGKLDQHDRGDRAVLDALESLEELLEGGAGERDDAANLSACTAAEEAVAARLVETRVWFLDAFAGERIDDPATVIAMERIDWTDYYPVIDGDREITGEFAYADSDDATMLNYDNEAMISRAEAEQYGWTINEDDGSAEPPEAE
jgi:hypothetical protein